jgi:hypothetical protein
MKMYLSLKMFIVKNMEVKGFVILVKFLANRC